MAGLVYLLSSATCLLCAVLLFRGYKKSGVGLLFWSSLCFLGLSLENAIVYVDLVSFAETMSLVLLRRVIGLTALMILIYGMVWDEKRRSG